MARGGEGQAFGGLAVDRGDEDAGTLPGQPLGDLGYRGFGRIAGREQQHREVTLDDARGTVQHFGGAVGLGMDAAGFLELERRFLGDGIGRAATEDIERLMTVECAEEGRPVAGHGPLQKFRQRLKRSQQGLVAAPVSEKGEPGESYNIGGGLELTNRELTERVLSAMGADWTSVQPVEDRKGHDRRYSVDDSRLRALGYAPQHRFEDGLAETVQWYRDNEAWWRPLKAKAAIG